MGYLINDNIIKFEISDKLPPVLYGDPTSLNYNLSTRKAKETQDDEGNDVTIYEESVIAGDITLTLYRDNVYLTHFTVTKTSSEVQSDSVDISDLTVETLKKQLELTMKNSDDIKKQLAEKRADFAEKTELIRLIEERFPNGQADVERAINIVIAQNGIQEAEVFAENYLKDAERDIVALPEYPMKKVLLEGVDFLRGRAF